MMGSVTSLCITTFLSLGLCGAYHFNALHVRSLALKLKMSEDCFTSDGEDSLQEFTDLFKSSLKRETFVGLRFSSRKVPSQKNIDLDAMKGVIFPQQQQNNVKEKGSFIPINDDLVSVAGRLVNMKSGIHLHLNAKFKTNDQAKNFHIDYAASSEVHRLLTRGSFRKAILLTDNVEYELSMRVSKDGTSSGTRLRVKSAQNTVPDLNTATHDRKKNVPIESSAIFLQRLKVVNKEGKPLLGMKDKLRQIEKFVEILSSLVRRASTVTGKRELKLTDMGSGMAYLTFAAHSYFSKSDDFVKVTSTGIENRLNLVEKTNRLAADLGPSFQGLSFQHSSIHDLHTGAGIEEETTDKDTLSVLVALHACDTATDDAIFYGISRGSDVIVTAPCCQKQLRPQIDALHGSSALFGYGIFRERQSEMITDAIRAKCLEAWGYKVTVAEFVGGEHTAKNVMIAAVKGNVDNEKVREAALSELRALFSTYHLHSHHLVSLLGVEGVHEEGRGASPSSHNSSLRPRKKTTKNKKK